jgi:hypothetical protein
MNIFFKVIGDLKKEFRNIDTVISAVESVAAQKIAARDILAHHPGATCIAASVQGPKKVLAPLIGHPISTKSRSPDNETDVVRPSELVVDKHSSSAERA